MVRDHGDFVLRGGWISLHAGMAPIWTLTLLAGRTLATRPMMTCRRLITLRRRVLPGGNGAMRAR
jgi:hypothetical protein